MAEGSGDKNKKRGKLIRPVAAIGVLGTMASIWWFALKPRRKPKD